MRACAAAFMGLAMIGCAATDSGREPTVDANGKRYVVERHDVAPPMSGVSSIETLRDRQTGRCFMVIHGNSAIAVIETACDGVANRIHDHQPLEIEKEAETGR